MARPIRLGRYLLVERVAIGGMAEVFAAVRPGDPPGRAYAVKRMLPTVAEHEELVRLFLDEARLQGQLDHPGIVPVREVGRIGARHYLVMDYVAGRALRALLDRARAGGAPLPVPLAAHVAWRVADALDHAHRRRGAGGAALDVVHRDVSPANVLLGFDGGVRLIDFGVARAAARGGAAPDAARGKLAYMSPEVLDGLAADRRADVFSLGAVLHEALTGERLFGGPPDATVRERIRAAAVRPPSAANPAVPPALDAVVLRALARAPEDRFAWASELRDALLPFAAGAPPDDPAVLARALAAALPEACRDEARRRERLEAARGDAG